MIISFVRVAYLLFYRIIQALEQVTSQLDLALEPNRRFIRKYVSAEVWHQGENDTLALGIRHNFETETSQTETIAPVMAPEDVDYNKTDAAIFLPEGVVRGKSRKHAYIISTPLNTTFI